MIPRNRSVWVVLLGAASLVAWLVIRAYPRSEASLVDIEVFYVAGKCWLEGKTTYDPAAWAEIYDKYRFLEKRDYLTFCVYPPTVAIVLAPAAVGSLGLFIGIVVLLAALGLVLGFAAVTILSLCARPELFRSPMFWCSLVACLGSTAVASAAINIGQFAPLALGAALGCFLFSCQGPSWPCLLLVPLAAVKPHVAAPIILFLALSRRGSWTWGGICVAALFALSALARAPGSISLVVSEYLEANAQFAAAVIDFDRPYNFQSLAGILGLSEWGGLARVVSAGLVMLAVACLAVRFRGEVAVGAEAVLVRCRYLLLILAICVGLMPMHGYDYVHLPFMAILSVVSIGRLWALACMVAVVAAAHHGRLTGLLVGGGNADPSQIAFYVPHMLHGLVMLISVAGVVHSSRARHL